LVGIVMKKGWEQIVGVLAVLKAGGTCLPIDADLPTERLLYLLETGDVRIALSQSGVDEEVAWPAKVGHFVVSEAALANEDDTPLEPCGTLDDLAYVIFTSGSTGLPKGVMIDHRGVANTILDVNERFGITSSDRVLSLSSLSFDLSFYDLFGILAAGGA